MQNGLTETFRLRAFLQLVEEEENQIAGIGEEEGEEEEEETEVRIFSLYI